MLRCCATPTVVVTAAITLLILVRPASGQELGQKYLDFELPNAPTLADIARTKFADGLAALFLMDTTQCVGFFLAAQTAGNNRFPMAAWGEAMCYYNPIMDMQDKLAGQKALDKLETMSAETQTLASQTTDYPDATLITAVQKLFSETEFSFEQRVKDYQNILRTRMTAKNFGEPIVNLLYAASTMPSTTMWGYFNDMDARATALDYIDKQLASSKNPKNPLANSLSLNLRNTPFTAYSVLEAGTTLVNIAPDSKKSYMMAALPLIRIGEWTKATNLLARGQDKGPSNVKPSAMYRRLQNYASLNTGNMAIANGRIDDLTRSDNGVRTKAVTALMKADYLLFSENWSSEDPANRPEVLTRSAEREYRGEYILVSSAYASRLFMHGVAILEQGEIVPYANNVGADLKALVDNLSDTVVNNLKLQDFKQRLNLMAQQYDALLSFYKGGKEPAIQKMSELVGKESALGPPPAGPPTLPIWPITESHALLLYKNKNYRAAQTAYQQTLINYPNRTSALIGAARSAKGEGRDDEALGFYETLTDIWKDNPNTGLKKEASDFVSSRREVVGSAIGLGAGVVLQLKEQNEQLLAPATPMHPDMCPINQGSFVLAVMLMVVAIVVLILIVLLLACLNLKKSKAAKHNEGYYEGYDQNANNDYSKSVSPTNLYNAAGVYDTYENVPAGGPDGGYTDHWPEHSPNSPNAMSAGHYDNFNNFDNTPTQRPANNMMAEPAHGWEMVSGGSPAHPGPNYNDPSFGSPQPYPTGPGTPGGDNGFTYGNGMPQNWQ